MAGWINWQNVRSNFVGGILRTLFVAICYALGFGPDKWASFLIAGMPFLITPGVARLAFLLLGSLTLLSLLWAKIVGSQPAWVKIISTAGVCLPFVAGAFFITANSMPVRSDRHLTVKEKNLMAASFANIPADQLAKVIVASVNDPEATGYATEFIYFFKYYNIPINFNAGGRLPDDTMLLPMIVSELGRATGLSISVKDADNPPESGKLLVSAMRNAGFPVQFEPFHGFMPGECMLTVDYN